MGPYVFDWGSGWINESRPLHIVLDPQGSHWDLELSAGALQHPVRTVKDEQAADGTSSVTITIHQAILNRWRDEPYYMVRFAYWSRWEGVENFERLYGPYRSVDEAVHAAKSIWKRYPDKPDIPAAKFTLL